MKNTRVAPSLRRRYDALTCTLIVAFGLSAMCSQANAQVIVADDFFYAQPTKGFGAGGGFTRQAYSGGQNGSLGQWDDQWNSFGDGVITGTDLSEETFVLETDSFQGVTQNGLSDNWLDRDYSTTGVDNEQTLFFGITMRSNDELALPNATFSINDGGGPAQIGMGLTQGGFRAVLGPLEEGDDFGSVIGPDITNGLDAIRLIGKLEFNAAGDDERLTVWLDPSDVETAEESIEIEADVVGGIADFNGNLRLDHVASPGLLFWDDLAVGTTWESVSTVTVPRVTLLADPESQAVQFKNETDSDLELIYVQLESESGLAEANWNSLQDQGVAGFQENNPTSNRLTESNFLGSLDFKQGASFGWGEVFSNSTTEDLIAQVATTGGLLNLANVVYGPIPVEEIEIDFDMNGVVDVADLDSLCSQISSAGNAAAFDLNGDGLVNGDELGIFQQQSNVLTGDTNLDGTVGFPDFLALSANFGQTSRTWSQGDFDCSGDVGFPDFLALSANFGQTAGAQAASVPEPATGLLLTFAAFGILGWRRRS